MNNEQRSLNRSQEMAIVSANSVEGNLAWRCHYSLRNLNHQYLSMTHDFSKGTKCNFHLFRILPSRTIWRWNQMDLSIWVFLVKLWTIIIHWQKQCMDMGLLVIFIWQPYPISPWQLAPRHFYQFNGHPAINNFLKQDLNKKKITLKYTL